MFEKLIFESSVPRVYASYPISRVRDIPQTVEEINAARRKLHEAFTVFDPVTIDERILRGKMEQTDPPPDTISIALADRWPLAWSECAMDPSDSYPIEIPTEEVAALGAQFGDRWYWQDIDDNIRWRDFALINQSQGVLAYRPRFGDQDPSRGVTRELNYALDVRLIPGHVYSPAEDGDFDSSPFSPSVVVDTDFEDAIENLRGRSAKEGR